MFGDDEPVSSADERDEGDREAMDRSAADRESEERRWYSEQRPPHHDTR